MCVCVCVFAFTFSLLRIFIKFLCAFSLSRALSPLCRSSFCCSTSFFIVNVLQNTLWSLYVCASVCVCILLGISLLFLCSSIYKDEQTQEKIWRSRCCYKQNQLSSNFLINNSQTNHFISHFFCSKKNAHSRYLSLFFSGCLAFSVCCLFILLVLLTTMFSPHFSIECIQFSLAVKILNCTCWFVLHLLLFSRNRMFKAEERVRERELKMILAPFFLSFIHVFLLVYIHSFSCFIREILMQKRKQIKSVLQHWMTRADVQMQRSDYNGEKNRIKATTNDQQQHQYKKMHTKLVASFFVC